MDFYVIASEPDDIITLLKEYYLQDEEVSSDPDFTTFKRYEKENVNVRTKPWYNQEIFIKLYQADEGRDLDNQHDLPYFSIQMRYDRNKKERVRFTWDAAETLLHQN